LPYDFLSLEDLGVRGDVEEKGMTFRENARLKSLAYSLLSDHLTLAEDSGLEINRLNGAPGIFSARFSGPRATDEKNIAKVLRLMKDVHWRERQARFVCHLALSRKGKIVKEARGQVRGYINLKKRGDHGFGYDPIFYCSPFKKTFGELSAEEKNKVSHRGRALRKMRTFLSAFANSSPK
jgi:XTP/dITP diphosphohydrolase